MWKRLRGYPNRRVFLVHETLTLSKESRAILFYSAHSTYENSALQRYRSARHSSLSPRQFDLVVYYYLINSIIFLICIVYILVLSNIVSACVLLIITINSQLRRDRVADPQVRTPIESDERRRRPRWISRTEMAKSSPPNAPSLQMLPPELFLIIVSFLYESDILSLSYTCRSFY